MCTNTQIDIDEGAEVVDVCKAIQDMNNKARQDGLMEGKKGIAFKLHDENGFTLESIASVVSENLSTVQRWFAERSSAVNRS